MPIDPPPNTCPLCHESAEDGAYGLKRTFNCPTCGHFEADVITAHALYYHSDRDQLSGVAREQHDSGRPINFTEKSLDMWLSLAPRNTDVESKARKLLRFIERKSTYPGEAISIHLKRDRAVCFAKNDDEVLFYVQYLTANGFIAPLVPTSGPEKILYLTPTGWAELQQSRQIDSSQAFVAMWFHKDMQECYQSGLHVAIERAGYRPVRIDYEQFNSKIDDQIISEIRRSRFLVSDVTGARTGVFFEAGFAMGLGIPVIWTCREDCKSDMHFDTRQYNHIIWTSASDLAEALEARIVATIGQGRFVRTHDAPASR